jgi:SAM-dependent methyltransferase
MVRKVTLKLGKGRSRPGARSPGPAKSRATRGARRTAVHPVRKPAHGRPLPAAAPLRAALKRSSPHPSEAENAEAILAAALEGSGTVSRLEAANRAVPRFPEDAYDYSYLQDFLGLDYVPRDCRAVVFGCGKGEEAVFFSERGYRVTGIDSDRNSIGLARERAWLNARDIDFMIGDVFESANLLPAESFGLASDRSVFRAVEGERERRRYLELVRRLLLPGGVFLLSATTVDTTRKVKGSRRRRRNQDDLLVQEGGVVMGEILRSGLVIAGRRHYPLRQEPGKADLVLYCKR